MSGGHSTLNYYFFLFRSDIFLKRNLSLFFDISVNIRGPPSGAFFFLRWRFVRVFARNPCKQKQKNERWFSEKIQINAKSVDFKLITRNWWKINYPVGRWKQRDIESWDCCSPRICRIPFILFHGGQYTVKEVTRSGVNRT